MSYFYPLILLVLVLASAPLRASNIVVKADIIYPVASDPIKKGVVVIRDGRIVEIGRQHEVDIPAGVDVQRAAVVTPGLVDAHSVVGLSGYLNQKHDQDQIERSEAVQPELRAIDAYNPREQLVQWLRSYGITTIHTGHGPGEVISGQTLIAKTSGKTVSESVIQPVAMIAATLGAEALADESSTRSSPGTVSKAAALLRSELLAAKAYLSKTKKQVPRSLRMESLGMVLEGDIPLLVTAHRHQDISTALRIAEEFDISIILDGAAESYILIEEIQAANVPVIIHPTMARATGVRKNLSFTTASRLVSAGVPLALQSGWEPYVPKSRVILFEAALTLAYGMTFDQALRSITLDAAKILGVQDRVGSIEVGKDGDLALFNGNPFEYTSHVTGTIIEGELVSELPH